MVELAATQHTCCRLIRMWSWFWTVQGQGCSLKGGFHRQPGNWSNCPVGEPILDDACQWVLLRCQRSIEQVDDGTSGQGKSRHAAARHLPSGQDRKA